MPVSTKAAYITSESIQKEELSTEQKLAVAHEINFWYEEVSHYIGEIQTTNVLLKIAGQLVDGNIDAANAVIFAENINCYIPAEQMFPAMPETLKNEGKQAVIFVQEKAKTNIGIESYSGYDRLAARDYAKQYTSNAPRTAAYQCSHGYSVYRDQTKWNTAVYTTYWCHTDCANYVSQCMAKGKLPTDSTWQPYTSAWISCSSMKNYLYTTKGYWNLSSFINAAAGGVIYMAFDTGNHIVMITLNDTVTRKYSGHTNDDLDRTYSSAGTGWTFYTLW